MRIEVIHPEHLVAAIFIYPPNVLRIGDNGTGSGGGVVPTSRDGFNGKGLKILTPWQIGDGIAHGGKEKAMAPWTHAIHTAVALHHGFVFGRGVQTAKCGWIFSIIDGLPFAGRLQFINGDVINIKPVCINRSIIDSEILGIFRHVF